MDAATLQDLLTHSMGFAAISALGFPALYSRVPWYRSILGRVMMAHCVALAFALGIRFTYRMMSDPDDPFRMQVAIAMYLIMGITNVWLFLVLYRIQREGPLTPPRHSKADAPDDRPSEAPDRVGDGAGGVNHPTD